jgi:hypothetical protein
MLTLGSLQMKPCVRKRSNMWQQPFNKQSANITIIEATVDAITVILLFLFKLESENCYIIDN